MNKRYDTGKSVSLIKLVGFSLIPLVVTLVVLEVGLRIVYFQMHGASPSALQQALHKLRMKAMELVSERQVRRADIPKGLMQALYHRPEGKELLAVFMKTYEEIFARFVEEAKRLDSRLLVLYLCPNPDEVVRSFFRDLVARHEIPFLDPTEEFSRYPYDSVTLSPENNHLSRFGNQILVRYLARHLSGYSDHRFRATFETRPPLLGDLTPNTNAIWTIAPNMPYRVISNSQGLRMGADLTFPKKKQRILCIGDSFTFGPYLSNHDTYPGLLQKRFPDKEIIHAGMAGYTIMDEWSLFDERAKYCEPDIIILQVTDNDIFDFFWFKRRFHDRKQRRWEPTPLERDFVEKWREILKAEHK